METLNEITLDTDNILAILKNGLPITSPKKKKSLLNEEYRGKFKGKLIDVAISPLEYINDITKTLSSLTKISTFDASSDKEDDCTQNDATTIQKFECKFVCNLLESTRNNMDFHALRTRKLLSILQFPN